ncbi:MAG: hypothetical protein LBD46_06370 [Endomicrobium sp.]|jgi:hypothetical protein|nr:hypothetical protein [Endomicrobium sp.]
MHIAKALGVKSVVLFGQTNAEYISYPENINIVSSLCAGCYTARRLGYGKCVCGYGTKDGTVQLSLYSEYGDKVYESPNLSFQGGSNNSKSIF